MDDASKRLVAKLEARFGTLESTVETPLATVYLFEFRAIKHYKRQRAFWGDLRDITYRQQFYEDDFFWNNVVSPAIYLSLLVIDDELFIEMERMQGTVTLLHALTHNLITATDIDVLQTMVRDAENRLSKTSLSQRNPFISQSARTLNENDLLDHARWLDEAPPVLQELLSNTLALLSRVLASSSYFDAAGLSTVIDANCDNILFKEGVWFLIDSMPQKESWRIFDPVFSDIRTETDIATLGIPSLAGSASGAELPLHIKLFYEIKAALIQMMLRYSMQQYSLAEKYEAVLRDRCTRLSKSTNFSESA